MKIGKFVGTDSMKLNADDVQTCFVLAQTGLRLETNPFYNGRELITDTKKIKGVHNGWQTSYRDRQFTAVPRNITLYIDKQVGKIETDKIFEYVEGSEGTIQYSAKLTLYGSLHYKYQRGWSDCEIYNYYDYDTDLKELLDRIISKYWEYKTNIQNNSI